MSIFRLIFTSLRHHWRVQAAVACGVAAATAVICGALIVGDSMRGSLRHLTLDRLGRVELALASDRFFRAALADELAAHARLDQHSGAAVPVILIQSSLARPDSPTPDAKTGQPGQPGANQGNWARANRVSLVGCDPRFWQLGPGGPPRPPDDGQIVLNQPLADLLKVSVGEAVSVRVPRLGAISADNPLGRKGEAVRSEVLTVSSVIPAQGLGAFSLRPNQQQPRNAFVSLEWLQDLLGQSDRRNPTVRANAILVAGPPGEVEPVLDENEIQAALYPSLADYGIRIRETARGYLNVTSDRMILEAAAEEAVLRACEKMGTGSEPRHEDRAKTTSGEVPVSIFPQALRASGGCRVQPALTYLANTIACGQRELPYSIVTAVDFIDRPPLGPMLTPEGKPIAPLADDEIVLNTWAADALKAKPGDAIRLDYFEPESTHGQVHQQSHTFRLKAIVQLAGPAADRDFTPEVPGLTDKDTIESWAMPSLIDTTRVHKPDEDYWKAHRGTPKAFVSLAEGRRLWASRFGKTTSLRIPMTSGLAERVELDPAAMGFVFQPVKRQGLEAAVGTTPFEVLFLAFSSFLLASAAILAALLFRLGIERRAAELGILLAVGLRRGQVARLLAAEGLLVAAAGGLAGIVLGIGYAALLLVGLQTLWLGAVVTPFLRLYVTPASLAIGYAGGVLIAVATILFSVHRVGRNPPRQLLAGRFEGDKSPSARHRRAELVAYAMLAVAVMLGLFAAWLSEEAQAMTFFAAGAMVLVAALVLIWTRLVAGSTGPAVSVGGGNLLRLAVRNAARNPTRSTLTVGLVSAACFLIVAVSAFRIDLSQGAAGRQSGTGGFTLVAESDQPIFYDLNTEKGRVDAGIGREESRALAGTEIIALRVRPGDDASCRNLYQPRQPRVLGVPRQLIERGGFAWAAALRPQPADERDPSENPWRLLEKDLGVDPGGARLVPAILEKNTADYSLHLPKGGLGQTYEIADDRGQSVPLIIVGLLGNSIFQGDLLISEDAFVRLFPDQSGYRFFLVQAADGQDSKAIQTTLERGLAEYGFSAELARDRLSAFLAVQNTYLLTFQSLGALGLLLGTFGLAAVQVRSVLERRRELALMRATGFRRRTLAGLITLENAVLLGGGLACGVLAALVAVLPHLFGGGASIPWGGLTGTFVLVFAVGLLAGLAAVRSVLTMPLLESLRSE
jgi:putative ABC transport system permease protein